MGKRSKIKGIAADVLSTGAEQSGEIIVSHIPDIASLLEETPVGAAVDSVANSILCAVAPGVYGGLLTFRQKRLERNTRIAIESLVEKSDILERRLSALELNARERFSGVYCDALLDNIVDENQMEKVNNNINAFMNIMKIEHPSDDMVFAFFHDLSELNELDLRILRTYSWHSL